MREATIPELELQLEAALAQRDDLQEQLRDERKAHQETRLILNGKMQASAKALELQDECIKLAKLVDTLLGTKGMLEASRDKAEQERDEALETLAKKDAVIAKLKEALQDQIDSELDVYGHAFSALKNAELAALEKDGTK